MPITPHQIRTARRRLGLTQRELASRLGVDSNTVARWERGERQPAGELLRLAMETLGACCGDPKIIF